MGTSSQAQASGALLVAALLAGFIAAALAIADRLLVTELPIALALTPVITLAALIAIWSGRNGAPALLARAEAAGEQIGPRTGALALALLFVALLIVARLVLNAFVNSSDEYANILQAKTYAQGRLWAPAPPEWRSFNLMRFVVKNGIWISAYYPGWSLWLTAAELLRIPLWVVNPFVGVLLAWAYFALARLRLSRSWAWLATLSFVLTAFFLLNLGSYFPHGVTTLYAVLFVICGLRYLETGRLGWAIGAGFLIGLVGLTRPYNAFIFAVPFIAWLLFTPSRRVGLLGFGLGGLPCFLAFLWYNAAITGDPLTPVQSWLQGEPFGQTASAANYTLTRWVRLYQWSSPVLLVGWCLAVVYKAVRRKLEFADLILPMTILAFMVYGGDGGTQFGPRYLFEAWPFIILTAFTAARDVLSRAEGRTAALVASAVVAHFAYQVGYTLPRLDREHRIISDRQDIYFDVEKAGVRNAVVFVAGDSGTNRPMWYRDLLRNGLVIGDESVTYAIDRGAANQRIVEMFPGRAYYRYRNGDLRPISVSDAVSGQGVPAEH